MDTGNRVLMKCSHCGCEFVASKRMSKRSRSRTPSKTSYCSQICRSSGQAKLMKKDHLKYRITCKKCGKTFESSTPKLYCNMKCWTSSEEWRRHLLLNAEKGRLASLKLKGFGPQLRVEITCLECGTKRMQKPSRDMKYCNRRCFRKYMAKRFDRWIANPETIALPQGYDEFLSKNELPCLVAGCHWSGKNLSYHMNMTHGVPKREFKRAAGFNLSSGIVGASTSALMAASAERRGLGNNGPPLASQQRGYHGSPGYSSLEGSEHRQKAMALVAAEPSRKTWQVCASCGEEYLPAALDTCSKYCSLDCRNAFYLKNAHTLKFWMECRQCSQDFEGSVEQQVRWEVHLPVFCCVHCRQRHNSQGPRAYKRLGETKANFSARKAEADTERDKILNG